MNQLPSLHTDAPVDQAIKNPLVLEALKLTCVAGVGARAITPVMVCWYLCRQPTRDHRMHDIDGALLAQVPGTAE